MHRYHHHIIPVKSAREYRRAGQSDPQIHHVVLAVGNMLPVMQKILVGGHHRLHVLKVPAVSHLEDVRQPPNSTRALHVGDPRQFGRHGDVVSHLFARLDVIFDRAEQPLVEGGKPGAIRCLGLTVHQTKNRDINL